MYFLIIFLKVYFTRFHLVTTFSDNCFHVCFISLAVLTKSHIINVMYYWLAAVRNFYSKLWCLIFCFFVQHKLKCLTYTSSLHVIFNGVCHLYCSLLSCHVSNLIFKYKALLMPKTWRRICNGKCVELNLTLNSYLT